MLLSPETRQASDEFDSLELDLKARDYDLQTRLNSDGKPVGTLFVYVSAK